MICQTKTIQFKLKLIINNLWVIINLPNFFGQMLKKNKFIKLFYRQTFLLYLIRIQIIYISA